MRNRTLAARNIGFVPVPLAKRFRQAHSTKKSHGGAPSKHSNSSRIRAQVMRNSTLAARNIGFVPVPLAKREMPKRCIWNLLKTKKRLPQARQTFAQRKTWKPASHQTKLKKKVFGTRMRKGRTPAGFVPKPLRNRSRKNAETSLLEPTKKKEV